MKRKDNKDVTVRFRVSTAESKKLDLMAKLQGYDVQSDYLRAQCLGPGNHPPDPKAMALYVAERAARMCAEATNIVAQRFYELRIADDGAQPAVDIFLQAATTIHGLGAKAERLQRAIRNLNRLDAK